MANQPAPQPATNAWSEPVDDLSARLRVEFENLEQGFRSAVYLELRNHSTNPVAVFDQPRLQAELLDSRGQPQERSGLTMSGPIRSGQWAVIPGNAYVGVRIDMQTAAASIQPHGALLAVGGVAWQLPAGTYVLNISAAFDHRPDGPEHQWSGHVVPPPVHVVVTDDLFASR
jgi:hypothetical protein